MTEPNWPMVLLCGCVFLLRLSFLTAHRIRPTLSRWGFYVVMVITFTEPLSIFYWSGGFA